MGQILAAESLALGLAAATTGAVLAVAASWALARYLFKVAFLAHAGLVLGGILVVALVTLVAGLLLSRGLANHPPLEILRREVE